MHHHPLSSRLAARANDPAARPGRLERALSACLTFIAFVLPWLVLVGLGIAVTADVIPAEVLVCVVIIGGVVAYTLVAPPRATDFMSPAPAAPPPRGEDDDEGGGGGGGGGPRVDPPEPSGPTDPGIDWDDFDREREGWNSREPVGV